MAEVAAAVAVVGGAAHMWIIVAGFVRTGCSQSAAEQMQVVDTAELVHSHSRMVEQ